MPIAEEEFQAQSPRINQASHFQTLGLRVMPNPTLSIKEVCLLELMTKQV